VAAPFPVFHIFVNNPELVKPSYARFLTNHIQEEFDLSGCPIKLVYKPPAAPRGSRRKPGAAGATQGDEQ
jgi:predicted GTPase